MLNKGYYSPHLKITAISLNCPNSLNVQPLFHCLHTALFQSIVFVYPVLLPGLKYKLAVRPHLFNGQGHHVTVAVTLQPEVDSNRFCSLCMAGLCSSTYVLTKSGFKWSLCTPNILWSFSRTTNLRTPPCVLLTTHRVDSPWCQATDVSGYGERFPS